MTDYWVGKIEGSFAVMNGSEVVESGFECIADVWDRIAELDRDAEDSDEETF